MRGSWKLVALLLALLAALALLASCGGGPGDSTQNTSASVSDTSASGTNTVDDTTGGTPEPGSITGLSFAPASYGGTLTWDAVDGADSYQVYLRKYGEDTFTMVASSVSDTNYDFSYQLGWGTTNEFYVEARSGGELIAVGDRISAKTNGVRVNDLAVSDDILHYYTPQMEHAGGSVLWINGEIWLVDSGNKNDPGKVTQQLLALRREFMGADAAQHENDDDYKLAVNVYATHYHVDHIGALSTTILKEERIVVENVYAPTLAAVVSRRSGTCTSFVSTIGSYSRTRNTQWIQVPYGEHVRIEFVKSDVTLDLYAALMDWTVEYYNEDGTPDKTRGWFYIYAEKPGDSATTLAQNCNSMWGVFTHGENRILFTGDTYDIDSVIINPMLSYYGAESFRANILVYLHHGHTRYSKALYDNVKPTYVVFSAPLSELDSSTPSKNSISYARRIGATLYYGALNSFTFTLDGVNITVEGDPAP